jgi:hypothetical protein
VTTPASLFKEIEERIRGGLYLHIKLCDLCAPSWCGGVALSYRLELPKPVIAYDLITFRREYQISERPIPKLRIENQKDIKIPPRQLNECHGEAGHAVGTYDFTRK